MENILGQKANVDIHDISVRLTNRGYVVESSVCSEDTSDYIMYSKSLTREVVSRAFCPKTFLDVIYPRLVKFLEVVESEVNLPEREHLYFDGSANLDDLEDYFIMGLKKTFKGKLTYPMYTLMFPLELIYDDWEEYLSLVKERIKKDKQNLSEKQKLIENKEFQEYLRLKQKFGDK